MEQLIPITEENGRQLVNARDLHAFLQVKSRFNDWITRRIIQYDFQENQDFVTLTQNLVNGGKTTEYAVTISMAKELCMVENNEQGKQARQYFIHMEKIARKQTFTLPSRAELAQMVIEAEQEKEVLRQLQAKAEQQIKQLQPKAELLEKIAEAPEALDIGQTAKLLELGYGRNTFFRRLKQDGIFFKHKSEPRQEYIERGYFKLKTMHFEHHDQTHVHVKVLVTQKGVQWLAGKYRKQRELPVYEKPIII